MINYANYDFYKETYCGSISNGLFNSLIPKASREIDKVVNRELKEEDIDDKIRFVACGLVDFLKENPISFDDGRKKISSFSIDGVTKNYVMKSENEIKEEKISILSGLPDELTRFL